MLTFALSLFGCAHVPTDPEALAEYRENNDPAELTNRGIFAGNQFVDRHVFGAARDQRGAAAANGAD